MTNFGKLLLLFFFFDELLFFPKKGNFWQNIILEKWRNFATKKKKFLSRTKKLLIVQVDLP